MFGNENNVNNADNLMITSTHLKYFNSTVIINESAFVNNKTFHVYLDSFVFYLKVCNYQINRGGGLT